ncbi:MAG TPA: aspartate--tRNA(Asn) ligase [Patescibacteria group bacterium]|nr:aspartate--tRNA(Asn) ligase [Patescibacteria group bacterium]
MNRTLNEKIEKNLGGEIEIKGWIKARRDMGKIVFLDLRDRSGLIQVVVVPSELDNESKKVVKELRPEYALQIKGQVNERGEKQKNPDIVNGNVEVLAKEIKVLSKAETLPYELGTDMHMDTYLDNLPLNLRSEKSRAIFKIQATLVQGFRNHLNNNDFVEFQCPKIVGGATEGGANVFTLDYFGGKAYLAQSPQFYKQKMVGVYERVYTLGKVYRAEAHDTNRHLSEYTSLDFEMGFINDYSEVMDMMYDNLKKMFATVNEDCAKEMKILNAEKPNLPKKYPVMTLKQVQEILEEEYNEEGASKEPDLEPHQEELIGRYVKEKFNSDILFVTHYPKEKRPVYTMPDPENPDLTLSFDVLFRGTEIVTGGQRIHDYEMLKKNMKEFGLNPQDFEYYLMAFKYGMPPEGGIGMGLERLTWRLLGLDNIKQATLFPRDRVRIDLPLTKIDRKD